MKARVKATGEIIDVRDCGSVFYDGAFCHGYVDINRNKYLPNDLEFDRIDGTPHDYWERLEHQYFGQLMQGLMSNPSRTEDYGELVNHAIDMAEDMVLAMKEKSYDKERTA